MSGDPRSPDTAGAPRRPSLIASASVTYGTNLAVALLSLVNVLIVSRALGPTGRGDVVFLMTIAYLTAQLATFSIQESMGNLGGAEPKLRPALASNSLVLSLLFGGAAAGILAALMEAFPRVAPDTAAGLRWLALASIPMLILQVALEFLVQADYRFTVSNAAWLLAPVTNVMVNGLLAALGAITVGTAFGTWVAGQALGTALLAWYVARRLAGFGRPNPSLARRMVGFGLKAHGGRVLMWGNFRLDQWLVGSIAGPRELGLYSVAVTWAETLFYLPTTLVAVQRPDLVRASRDQAARQAAALLRVAVVITVPLAVGLVLASPLLTVTIFGGEFRGSIDDLRALAAGALGIVALKLLGNALVAQRKPLLETAATGIAFTATIAFDILLIPPYGGLGAAVAASLAYMAGGVAVALIARRALGTRLADLAPRWSEVRSMWRTLRDSPRRPAADASFARSRGEPGP